MNFNGNLHFVNVAKESLKTLLMKAKDRIIFAKPAFYEWEIETILNVQKENDLYCELYFEQDDQAIRFGFGEHSALQKLANQIEGVSIQTVNRISLSLLVIDNETLIYSPNIAYIDDDSITNEFPNGIYGGSELTKKILEVFPSYLIDFPETLNDLSVTFDIPRLQKKQKETVKQQISETLKKLDNNPAVNPKNLKRIYFYRNKYKLVKFELHGIKIKNKKLNLNPFIRLLEGQNERLISSWNIFSKDDVNKLEDMAKFEHEFKKITSDYLINIGRFGYIIEVDKKNEFSSKVKAIKTDFISYLKGEAKEGNIFIMDDREKPNLKEILNSSKDALINHLITITSNNASSNIIIRSRHLFRLVEDNKLSQEKALKSFIDEFVDNKLKFPVEHEIVDRIDIKIDYYDISDELIYENEDFQDILKKTNLLEGNLREHSQGMEVLDNSSK